VKKILILSTDTRHHRYFINSLSQHNFDINACIFETTHVTSPFPTGPLFEDAENEFEQEHFFKKVHYELKADIINVKNINDSNSVGKIREINPDLGISFGVRRLSKQVIELFNDGLMNVHRGIAQEYRGLDSNLWAIYHSDYSNIGVTIHRVTPELDAGSIIYQKKLVLKPQMRAHQLRFYTTVIATSLVMDALRDYLSNKSKMYPQKKRGRYYSFMSLNLKRIVVKKINTFCETINE